MNILIEAYALTYLLDSLELMINTISKGLILVTLLVMTSCSQGPGSKDELKESLVISGNISESQADCITEAIFEEYGDNEDALKRITDLSVDELSSDDENLAVKGFEDFYENTLNECL